MSNERWAALSVVILLVALLAALMLMGCSSPPRKVKVYTAADFWVDLPSGKRIEKSYRGFVEVDE